MILKKPELKEDFSSLDKNTKTKLNREAETFAKELTDSRSQINKCATRISNLEFNERYHIRGDEKARARIPLKKSKGTDQSAIDTLYVIAEQEIREREQRRQLNVYLKEEHAMFTNDFGLLDQAYDYRDQRAVTQTWKNIHENQLDAEEQIAKEADKAE